MDLRARLRSLVVWGLKLLSSRIVKFGIVGLALTIFGAVFIAVAVPLGMSPEAANLVQALISVTLNFILSNRLTWNDRKHGRLVFRVTRYTLSKVVSITLNQEIFKLALKLTTPQGAYWISTGFITIYNYIVNEFFVFRKKGKPKVKRGTIRRLIDSSWLTRHPLVSIIVPLRNSGSYINRLLASLFAQDYVNFEVILVGGPEDTTWAAIDERYLSDPRLRIEEAVIPANHEGRDSNIKRNHGTRAAWGSVLFFTDAKIAHDSNWLSMGLYLMEEHQVEAVAGIMLAPPTQKRSFLLDYTDYSLITRNPDFRGGFLLDRLNFGNRESLPITACWAMTKTAYELMKGFDETFTISYEDYSAAWRFVRAGGVFFCTSEWRVWHKHRDEFKAMKLEFIRSARGAGQLTYAYPDCPFGKRRLLQALLMCMVPILGIPLLLYLITQQLWVISVGIMAFGFLAFVVFGIINVWKADRWYACFFPVLLAYFLLLSAFHYMHQYVVKEGGGRFLQTMWQLVLHVVLRTQA